MVKWCVVVGLSTLATPVSKLPVPSGFVTVDVGGTRNLLSALLFPTTERATVPGTYTR